MRNRYFFHFIRAAAVLMAFLLALALHLQLQAQEQNVDSESQINVVNNLYFPIIFKNAAFDPPNRALTFSGGPLYRADIGGNAWYLRADSRISLGPNGAEPFPFDPELDANSIATKQDVLYALAEDGLYKRAADTLRWQQVNDTIGHFLSAGVAELWYTPTDHPDQVWVSKDDSNWVSQSSGLSGTVISPVFFNPSYNSGYFLLTQNAGKDILWHANDASGTFQWQEVSTVPGAALDQSKGLFSRVVDASNGLGVAVMLGGGDGKLYEYRFYNSIVPTDTVGEGWVQVWDFGSGNYALPLINTLGPPAQNEVAVIDQTSGKITRYEGVIVEDTLVPKREWRIKPFPYEGLTFGVATLSNGKAVQRLYNSINEPLSLAQMYLTEDGALARYEMDPGTASYTLSEVILQPQRIDFSLTYSSGIDFIGALYSGATLNWQDGNCTGSENGFYRSDDKGQSWLSLASDTPRQPLFTTRGNLPATLLAMSCTGPQLSTNGGVSWTMPAEIHWPLTVGASHFVVKSLIGSAADTIFYAAGTDGTGSSFVYSSTFDATTSTVGDWHSMAPAGLITPTAFAFVSSNFNPDMGLYLADANTVWMSKDGGVTWSSRGDGLQGATVIDFTGFSNLTGEGVIAATDQGVLFAPAIDQAGAWIPAAYSYTTAPIGFDGPGMLRGFANGKEAVFNLPVEEFSWQ